MSREVYTQPDPRPPLSEDEQLVIYRAKTQLMKRLNWTEPAAYHWLRNQSMVHRTKLPIIAEMVLDGRIVASGDDNGG